ncbi:uncharacterized protein CLUP02_04129 [Colletotrichum lupini]|uniref:Uncharacterized protein n=1 Tax=Colletotrichum lupini TaxID=145971 RepID=A0A9Q8WDE2_9PEZI|nr:uncharacterized protein CLUP02_04129 [Colletotrichum lupini]UQC78652.1 hypothetical protein CLUP02_04129 [Colletotrichum lupini]
MVRAVELEHRTLLSGSDSSWALSGPVAGLPASSQDVDSRHRPQGNFVKGDETPATLLSLPLFRVKAQPYKTSVWLGAIRKSVRIYSVYPYRWDSYFRTLCVAPQLARACDWCVSAKAVSWPASNLSADVYPPSSGPPRFASSHCSHSQEDVDGADGGGGGAAAAAATRGFVPSCAVLRCT